MTEARHTPGPWVVMNGQWADHSEDGGGGFHIFMGEYAAADGIGIISARLLQYGDGFYPEDNGYEEVEANARLIAAAPELLEAAREALRFITNIDNAHSSVRLLRAAIAKSGSPS